MTKEEYIKKITEKHDINPNDSNEFEKLQKMMN